jgi:hypothetical protein
VTAQGHSRSIFRRAIENGNVLVAEMASRELGRISLDESLALTALVVEKDPGRRSRYAVRWLLRLLQENENLTIEEAGLAASALVALGGRGHAEALATLSAMAERATRQRQTNTPLRIRRLPVIEDDRVVGILAQADVAQEVKDKKAGQVLEAISQPASDGNSGTA